MGFIWSIIWFIIRLFFTPPVLWITLGVIGFIVLCFVFAYKNEPKKTTNNFIPRNNFNNTQLKHEVKNELRIMNDCLHIVNTSNNIEIVVRRFHEMSESLRILALYENNPDVTFPQELPSKALDRLYDEESQIMINAIERSYNAMVDSSEQLKTEAGRKNRRAKYFTSLENIKSDMPKAAKDFIIALMNNEQPMSRINATMEFELLNKINALISRYEENNFDSEIEFELLGLVEPLMDAKCLSPTSVADALKSFGDSSYNAERPGLAYELYQKAINKNPKLPLKRKIDDLHKLITGGIHASKEK